MYTKEVVLVGTGPSTVTWFSSEGVKVAVINRAFDSYFGPKDYWFSLHPDTFFSPSCAYEVRMIGGGDKKGKMGHYEFVQGYRYEGTSALFAVRWLIEQGGYDKVILFGIDMDGDYACERHHWYPFLDKHRDKLFDCSYTQWIKNYGR